jgi:hypothetical protein
MSQNISDVNVAVHRQEARDRVRATSRLQEAVQTTPTTIRWYERLWGRIFTRENLIVAGREIKNGWVVPQALGVALILVIISGTSVLYWRIIDKQASQDKAFSDKFERQNELLIRLDQRLIDKSIHDAEEERKTKEANELQDMKIQDMKEKLLVLNAKRGN